MTTSKKNGPLEQSDIDEAKDKLSSALCVVYLRQICAALDCSAETALELALKDKAHQLTCPKLHGYNEPRH